MKKLTFEEKALKALSEITLEAAAKRAYAKYLEAENERVRKYRERTAQEAASLVKKLLGLEAKAEPEKGVASLDDFLFAPGLAYGKLRVKKKSWDHWEEVSCLVDLGRLLEEEPQRKPPPIKLEPKVTVEERIASALERIATRLEEIVLCLSTKDNH